MDIMVKSFKEVDFNNMVLPMIVIYDKVTQDYPGVYIARVWEGTTAIPTNIMQANIDLEELRKDIIESHIPGFFSIRRAETDDPVILETWL